MIIFVKTLEHISQSMKRTVKYPLDTASFRGILEDGYIYIDKTRYIDKMSKQGVFYFLARPRRFGKSLFLDALAEYFSGDKELFKGLEIDKLQPTPWISYPVVRFNLSGTIYTKEDSLEKFLSSFLTKYEREYGIEPSQGYIDSRFQILIETIRRKSGHKVVILIDEYDAPLSSAIGKPELQEIYQEQLHGFYSVLKQSDSHIRFCMLTGVTRYGKVSVFSGLNNLHDITFSDDYAAICGITTEELIENYKEGIQFIAEKNKYTVEEAIEELKFNYDGYHFSASLVDIYNPYCINYAMYYGQLDNYWSRSGVPTILSKSLLNHDFDVEKLNGKKVEMEDLVDLSMYALNPIPLFYQTGYLTLKDYDSKKKRFTLGYPNREVEEGLLKNILSVYLPDGQGKKGFIYDMEDALEEGNPELFIKVMKSFLSGIPSKLHTFVDKYENYYHTIFYCMTKLIGLDIGAEYNTSEGFIDILIKTENYIYIIELKLNGTAEDAIKQIEEKNYCDPLRTDHREIIKIGIGFSKKTHSIGSYIII